MLAQSGSRRVTSAATTAAATNTRATRGTIGRRDVRACRKLLGGLGFNTILAVVVVATCSAGWSVWIIGRALPAARDLVVHVDLCIVARCCMHNTPTLGC